MSRKPFLLAICRHPGPIADDESARIRHLGGLGAGELRVIWLIDEATNIAELNLGEYAGVFISGSSFDFTGDYKQGEPGYCAQRNALALAKRVLEENIPTFAICFGMQALCLAQGGALTHLPEDMQASSLSLTDAAATDPLTAGLPLAITSYTGHHDGLAAVPADGVLLAIGENCPIQMVRWGSRAYGVQFHPEIEWDGMFMRIGLYGDAYYPAGERQQVIDRNIGQDVSHANALITRFVDLFTEGAR